MCGEYFKALEACTEAVQDRQKMLGETHPFMLEMLILQGTVLHKMGRNENAVAAIERVSRTIDATLEDFLIDFKMSPIQITLSSAAAA